MAPSCSSVTIVTFWITVNMTVAGRMAKPPLCRGLVGLSITAKAGNRPSEPVEKKKIKATSQNIDKNDENTLSFVEQHRLKKPGRDRQLEAEIAKLETYHQRRIYSTAPLKFERQRKHCSSDKALFLRLKKIG